MYRVHLKRHKKKKTDFFFIVIYGHGPFFFTLMLLSFFSLIPLPMLFSFCLFILTSYPFYLAVCKNVSYLHLTIWKWFAHNFSDIFVSFSRYVFFFYDANHPPLPLTTTEKLFLILFIFFSFFVISTFLFSCFLFVWIAHKIHASTRSHRHTHMCINTTYSTSSCSSPVLQFHTVYASSNVHNRTFLCSFLEIEMRMREWDELLRWCWFFFNIFFSINVCLSKEWRESVALIHLFTQAHISSKQWYNDSNDCDNDNLAAETS